MCRSTSWSSIILILFCSGIGARAPDLFFQGDTAGQDSAAQSGIHIESPELELIAESSRDRIFSLRWTPESHYIALGNRFWPGPPTGFYRNGSDFNHLPGLPHAARVNAAFFATSPESWNTPVYLGLGSLITRDASQPGESNTPELDSITVPPDPTTSDNPIFRSVQSLHDRPNPVPVIRWLLDDWSERRHRRAVDRNPPAGPLVFVPDALAFFYYPPTQEGYASVRGSHPGASHQFRGTAQVYRDSDGVGGFSRALYRTESLFPLALKLEGGRDPLRDTRDGQVFPGRKGKSGEAYLQFYSEHVYGAAGGEDRERMQYRWGRLQLASPAFMGTALAVAGEYFRTFRYGGSQGPLHHRSLGLGFVRGEPVPTLDSARPLGSAFSASAFIHFTPHSMSTEFSLRYSRGYLYMDLGIRSGHRDIPFQVTGNAAPFRSSLTVHPHLMHLIRAEAGYNNVYLRLLYLQSRKEERPREERSRFFAFRLECRWTLE